MLLFDEPVVANLQDALLKISKIIAKKSSLPILEMVLIKPTENGISISTTDLDIWYQADISYITANESFAIPFLTLQKIIKTNKNIKKFIWDNEKKQVSIMDINNSKIVIMAGCPEEEFPLFEKINIGSYKEIKIPDFQWVTKAMDPDETRIALRGIYLDMLSSNMVATDGARLHLTEIDKLEVNPVFIPAKMAQILSFIKAKSIYIDSYYCPDCTLKRGKLCKACEEHKSYIIWKSTNEYLIVKSGDTLYPNYKAVIPDKFNFKYVIDKKVLLIALGSIKPFVFGGNFQFSFIFNDKKHSVSAKNIEVGESEKELNGAFNGTPMEGMVAFNINFFLDAIQQKGENVCIEFTSKMGVCKISMDENTSKAFIMPCRMEDVK